MEMFCTQCGARNDESALHCTQCGATLPRDSGTPTGPEPPKTAVPPPDLPTAAEEPEDPELMATRRLSIADLGLMNLPPAPAEGTPASPETAASGALSMPPISPIPESPPLSGAASASTPVPPPPAAAAAPYVAPGAYPPPSAATYVPSETQYGMPMQNVPNYMVQAILLTVCCCLPFGVVAIVFAAQVNSKLAQGDLTGAMEASGKARMFCWIGLIGGVVFDLCLFAFQFYRMRHLGG
jgi:Interferon-induced transmembrane protein/zinc-ribbon domain